MSIISVAIQKGGSGKTTTSINLAAAISQMGKSILLVDMDPQANLTQSLGFRDVLNQTVYHQLKQLASGQHVDVNECILRTGQLSIIPASLELANAEIELVSVYGRENLLKKLLSPLTDRFDYILIDCPPSLGMLTVNSLTASNLVLIPMQAEYLPFKGLESFMLIFKKIRQQTNRDLQVLGIVVTKYDARKKMTHNVMNMLTSQFREHMFKTKIRPNIALAAAQENGLDIFRFDRTSNGAYDYLSLAEECLERIQEGFQHA